MWRSYQTSSNDPNDTTGDRTPNPNKRPPLLSLKQRQQKERKPIILGQKTPLLIPQVEPRSLKMEPFVLNHPKPNLTNTKTTTITDTTRKKRQFSPTNDQELEESKTTKIRNMGNIPTKKDPIEVYRNKFEFINPYSDEGNTSNYAESFDEHHDEDPDYDDNPWEQLIQREKQEEKRHLSERQELKSREIPEEHDIQNDFYDNTSISTDEQKYGTQSNIRSGHSSRDSGNNVKNSGFDTNNIRLEPHSNGSKFGRYTNRDYLSHSSQRIGPPIPAVSSTGTRTTYDSSIVTPEGSGTLLSDIDLSNITKEDLNAVVKEYIETMAFKGFITQHDNLLKMTEIFIHRVAGLLSAQTKSDITPIWDTSTSARDEKIERLNEVFQNAVLDRALGNFELDFGNLKSRGVPRGVTPQVLSSLKGGITRDSSEYATPFISTEFPYNSSNSRYSTTSSIDDYSTNAEQIQSFKDSISMNVVEIIGGPKKSVSHTNRPSNIFDPFPSTQYDYSRDSNKYSDTQRNRYGIDNANSTNSGDQFFGVKMIGAPDEALAGESVLLRGKVIIADLKRKNSKAVGLLEDLLDSITKRLESQRTGSGSGYSSFLNTTGDAGSVPSTSYTYETRFSERASTGSSKTREALVKEGRKFALDQMKERSFTKEDVQMLRLFYPALFPDASKKVDTIWGIGLADSVFSNITAKMKTAIEETVILVRTHLKDTTIQTWDLIICDNLECSMIFARLCAYYVHRNFMTNKANAYTQSVRDEMDRELQNLLLKLACMNRNNKTGIFSFDAESYETELKIINWDINLAQWRNRRGSDQTFIAKNGPRPRKHNLTNFRSLTSVNQYRNTINY